MAKSDAREDYYGGYQNAPKGPPGPAGMRGPGNVPGARTGDLVNDVETSLSQSNSVSGSSYVLPRGVYMPMSAADQRYMSTTLEGVLNRNNRWSTSFNRLYTAYSRKEGQPEILNTIPTWQAEALADYQWLFEIIAKDYHYSATGAKQYSDKKEQDGFVQQALKDFDLTGSYTNVVQSAYEYAQRRGLITSEGKLTPKGRDAYRKAYKDDAGSGGGGGGGYGGGGGGYGGGGGGGGSAQVDLTNPTTARGLIQQTIKQVLGRDASSDEVSEFIKILNEAEANNPRMVASSGSGVTVSGGTDPGVLAVDYAESLPDFEDRQASQYYKAFMQAMVGGGM